MKNKKRAPLADLSNDELDKASGGGWAGDVVKYAGGSETAGHVADFAAGVGGALYAATPAGFAYNLAAGAYDVYHTYSDPTKSNFDVALSAGFAVASLVPGVRAYNQVSEAFGNSVAKAVAGGAPTYLAEVERAAAPTLTQAIRETAREEVVKGAAEKLQQEVGTPVTPEQAAGRGSEVSASAHTPGLNDERFQPTDQAMGHGSEVSASAHTPGLNDERFQVTDQAAGRGSEVSASAHTPGLNDERFQVTDQAAGRGSEVSASAHTPGLNDERFQVTDQAAGR